jgi:hypothetical protein
MVGTDALAPGRRQRSSRRVFCARLHGAAPVGDPVGVDHSRHLVRGASRVVPVPRRHPPALADPAIGRHGRGDLHRFRIFAVRNRQAFPHRRESCASHPAWSVAATRAPGASARRCGRGTNRVVRGVAVQQAAAAGPDCGVRGSPGRLRERSPGYRGRGSFMAAALARGDRPAIRHRVESRIQELRFRRRPRRSLQRRVSVRVPLGVRRLWFYPAGGVVRWCADRRRRHAGGPRSLRFGGALCARGRRAGNHESVGGTAGAPSRDAPSPHVEQVLARYSWDRAAVDTLFHIERVARR